MPELKIIKIEGEPVDSTVVDHPSEMERKIRAGGNRWRIVVELTWDVTAEDITPRWMGDTDEDFANRAWYRIRESLNAIIGKGRPFAHWHLIKRAHRCLELD